MNSGIRQKARRNWPRGLREPRPGYFTWSPPVDVLPFLDKPPPKGGYVLGRMALQEAIAQVTEAYLSVHGKMTAKRLVDTIQSAPDTVAEWIPAYLAAVQERDVKPKTLAGLRRYLARVAEAFGHVAVSSVTTRNVADYLAQLADRPRTQQAVRSLLLDFFREAIAAGWAKDNPVDATRAASVRTQRGRLSLEAFRAIHAWSEDHHPGCQTRAIELAIVTAQRLADVCALRFIDAHDGFLWVTQQKTGAKVAIPLGLRLDALGWTVAEVLERCRDRVLSRHVLHHARKRGAAMPGAPLFSTTVSRHFASARDGSGVSVQGKTPPTFHELRSLSLRLYAEQGVNVQALAGHKSADMTSVYRDVRGDEWVQVS